MGVSVVVAVVNLERDILECLESVAAQDVDDLEIIVMDDASTDRSLEIIRGWQARQTGKIRVIANESNLGVLRTTNAGLRACTQEYLSLLDGDDTLEPGVLKAHCSLLDGAGPEVAVVFGNVQKVSEDGSPLDTPCYPSRATPKTSISSSSSTVRYFPLIGTVMRRSVVEDLGGLDESLPYFDWLLWLTIARNHKFRFSGQLAGQYRQHPMSLPRTGSADLRLARIEILSRIVRQRPTADERQAINVRARTVVRLMWSEDDGIAARRACRRLLRRAPEPRLVLLVVGMSAHLPHRHVHRVSYWSRPGSWRTWWHARHSPEA